ncbi:DUF262 [Desulfonema limicola]|uniref:DUF262 n=1 Tax=Desulfonema limicola TaxID=45656 RepID=A0A975B9C0_9BACT|nr:DUF262 domain-containing protein [Desulfonema limicola]QTA81066.1 DUF262 [Desulfonema limicola]
MEIDGKYSEDLAADGSFAGVESDDYGHDEQEPFDPEKISIEPKVVAMDAVIRRLIQGSIRLAPAFQRNEVWDIERKSQLIESMMLKIPVPMFYVAANEKGNWDVVDGLQRLTTIKDFVIGREYFKTKNEELRGKGFKLNCLEFWNKFNDHTFSELPEHIVNRILETQFQFTIINPGTPEEVKRNVFKRINTGGMPLTAQEIRHALYQGKSSELLAELVESSEYKKATSKSVKDSRMAGRELILRFLAFSIRDYTQYPKNSDMDAFLSDTMRVINLMPDLPEKELSKIFHTPGMLKLKFTKIDELRDRFTKAMIRAHKLFDTHTFRKSYGTKNRSPINKTLFEVWGNLLADLDDEQFDRLLSQADAFLNQYNPMLDNQDIANMISKHSWKYSGVKDRYEKFSKILKQYV